MPQSPQDPPPLWLCNRYGGNAPSFRPRPELPEAPAEPYYENIVGMWLWQQYKLWEACKRLDDALPDALVLQFRFRDGSVPTQAVEQPQLPKPKRIRLSTPKPAADEILPFSIGIGDRV